MSRALISAVVLRRWVAQLLLLALVARAFVPAGYMPDFKAAAEGFYKVVICTASGVRTIDVASDHDGGAPSKDPLNGHGTEACPFTGTLVYAKPDAGDEFIAAPFALAGTLKPESRPLASVRRIGPALGSRGPPALFSIPV